MKTQLKSTMNGLAIVCAIGSFACSSDQEALLEMTVTEVGSAGGVARSSDGLLAVEFANGALAQSTEITVTVVRDHGRSDVLSPVYELGPDGLEFDTPVTLTIEALGETGALALANLDNATAAVLADSTQSGSTVRGTLEHFSAYGVVAGTSTTPPTTTPPTTTPPNPSNSLAEVTGGATNVLLDLAALSAAGLDLSAVSEEVITPGDLGPDSIAFPINGRPSREAVRRRPGKGNAPTTFVYDFVNFAPVSGTIEHKGLLYFDQQFGSGNFSIGFDAARATGANSGFFVESTTDEFLEVPGVFFDVGIPSRVDAQVSSLTIEADLRVAPELAAFLRNPTLVGADVGDARISATAQLFTGPPAPVGNIVEVARAAGNFGTLLQTATDLGLAGVLTTPGPFTVFAPTDAAFAALPADLSHVDSAILANIILAHIADGELDAAALLTAGEVTTLAKVTHEFSFFGIRGAQVQTTDVEASNGIIHILDNVIIPPTTVAAALENGLTELVNAIVAASLATRIAVDPDTLDGDAPITVFAPTNAAFQGANLQGEDLDAVLATHVVAGQLLSSDLTPGRIITTVGGNRLTVGSGGPIASLTDERGNTFSVLTADIRTLSGAVHVIDGVLLPRAGP